MHKKIFLIFSSTVTYHRHGEYINESSIHYFVFMCKPEDTISTSHYLTAAVVFSPGVTGAGFSNELSNKKCTEFVIWNS